MKLSIIFTLLAAAVTARCNFIPPPTPPQHHLTDAPPDTTPPTAIPQNDTYQTPHFTYHELLGLQSSLWSRFRYPANVAEAASINSTIFSPDVQGRVSDTRNFLGRELNTEYIFGLFTPSDSVSIIGQPGAWEIVQFAANGNIASASTRVQFTFPAFGNVELPVMIDTWISWNEDRQISQYDVVFRWFGYLLDTLLRGDGTKPIPDAQKAAVIAMATSICKTHAQYCAGGPNTQYESGESCFRFLTQEIRVGQSFELGMNTLMCRSVHEVMVKYRPNVHCAHIGPSGGGMCGDEISYREKVGERYFVNSPWIPVDVTV